MPFLASEVSIPSLYSRAIHNLTSAICNILSGTFTKTLYPKIKEGTLTPTPVVTSACLYFSIYHTDLLLFLVYASTISAGRNTGRIEMVQKVNSSISKGWYYFFSLGIYPFLLKHFQPLSSLVFQIPMKVT